MVFVQNSFLQKWESDTLKDWIYLRNDKYYGMFLSHSEYQDLCICHIPEGIFQTLEMWTRSLCGPK